MMKSKIDSFLERVVSEFKDGVHPGSHLWWVRDEAARLLAERSETPATLSDALQTIQDIAEGSTTANSLPHIVKITRDAIAAHEPTVFEERLREVLAVVQAYLPGNGTPANEAMGKIIELVDPWPVTDLPASEGQEPEYYDSEKRCRAYYESGLRPYLCDGMSYAHWQAVWMAAQFDMSMRPNNSEPRPHPAPQAVKECDGDGDAAGAKKRHDAEKIADAPLVDEALASFNNDPTRDNAVGLVLTILEHVGVVPRPAVWTQPPKTVAELIGNLQTTPDLTVPIYSAYHIIRSGEPSICKVKTVCISRERVVDGKIDPSRKDVPYSLVVWAHPQVADRATVIELTPAEIQSGLSRVDWAEGLIRQLPADHDGRNSWLLNYAKEQAK